MSNDEVPDSSTTTAERLLALQAIDTEADQLRHRRDRLAERDEHAGRVAAVAAWEQRRDELERRIDALGATVEAADRESEELNAHKLRLEAQLKTVIAPREAEALMSEIALLDERSNSTETTELEAMEEQTELERQLDAHRADEMGVREALAVAETALAEATGEIDSAVSQLDERRAVVAADLDPALLARYDRMRAQLGVAVARLEGKMCGGCHLDLSAAELDTAREEGAESGTTDCPQCGRILVV